MRLRFLGLADLVFVLSVGSILGCLIEIDELARPMTTTEGDAGSSPADGALNRDGRVTQPETDGTFAGSDARFISDQGGPGAAFDAEVTVFDDAEIPMSNDAEILAQLDVSVDATFDMLVPQTGCNFVYLDRPTLKVYGFEYEARNELGDVVSEGCKEEMSLQVFENDFPNGFLGRLIWRGHIVVTSSGEGITFVTRNVQGCEFTFRIEGAGDISGVETLGFEFGFGYRPFELEWTCLERANTANFRTEIR